jgi:hypothetical protein
MGIASAPPILVLARSLIVEPFREEWPSYETSPAIAEKSDALLFAGQFTMEVHRDGHPAALKGQLRV